MSRHTLQPVFYRTPNGRIASEKVPREVVARASRRWDDAMMRGGFDKAVIDTRTRINKITEAAKLRGILVVLSEKEMDYASHKRQAAEIEKLYTLAEARLSRL